MRRIFLAGASIALALACTPSPAAAADTPYASVEVAPARIELAVPNAKPVHRTFVVANLSTSAETVHIEQADFTVANQTYQFLQPGATPWSIAPGLQLSATDLHLLPKAQAKVDLTYTPLSQAALRAGALLFTPTSDTAAKAPTGAGVIVKQQVVVPVLAVPAGSDGLLNTSVRLTAAPAGMALPNAWGLPALSFQETGPVVATATFRNTGNAIGRFDTWFTYSNLGRDFLSTEAPPGVALPGQTSAATGTTRVQLPGQAAMADTTPMFGIIRVHADSSLVLLGQRSAVASQERYVVVAPWRVLGLLLAIIGGAWWGARHRRRRA